MLVYYVYLGRSTTFHLTSPVKRWSPRVLKSSTRAFKYHRKLSSLLALPLSDSSIRVEKLLQAPLLYLVTSVEYMFTHAVHSAPGPEDALFPISGNKLSFPWARY